MTSHDGTPSSCLAIIPARGGSKRLPRKNVRVIAGKPLICHTIDAAIASGRFSDIILNSDDAEILSFADKYPQVTAETRPARLATDTTKVLELICEIADRTEVQKKHDAIALLLPTCPFRSGQHIREGMSQLTRDYDSVVSVTTYEFPPQLGLFRDEQSSMISGVFDPCPLITGDTRSQDQKLIYRPNGGFYISWLDRFVANRNYFRGKVRGFPMDRLDSVDVDNELDMEYADFVWHRHLAGKH